MSGNRDVAQLASALRSGRRGRAFESHHPDHTGRASEKSEALPVLIYMSYFTF
jgi:hypothetical protein